MWTQTNSQFTFCGIARKSLAVSDLQNYAVGISHHAHRAGNLGEQSSDISIRKFQLYSSSIHFAAKKLVWLCAMECENKSICSTKKNHLRSRTSPNTPNKASAAKQHKVKVSTSSWPIGNIVRIAPSGALSSCSRYVGVCLCGFDETAGIIERDVDLPASPYRCCSMARETRVQASEVVYRVHRQQPVEQKPAG